MKKPELKLERFFVWFLTEKDKLSYRIIKAYTKKQALKRFEKKRGTKVQVFLINL